MSLSITHARLVHHPAVGVLKAHFTVELGVVERIDGPGDSSEKAQRRALRRIYGDIAEDFEAFLKLAFTDVELTAEAGEARDRIRAKLSGEGPGTEHKAP